MTAVEDGRRSSSIRDASLSRSDHGLTGGPVTTSSGHRVPPLAIRFTTANPERRQSHAGWESGRPPSPWQQLPPLEAGPGVTALAGQILTLNGKPLAHVTLRLASATATTDSTGRFVLSNVPPGRQELVVDARTASRPGRTYGFFMIAVDVEANGTTALPFTIWMPVLDMAHTITLPAGGGAFVARTPRTPDWKSTCRPAPCSATPTARSSSR